MNNSKCKYSIVTTIYNSNPYIDNYILSINKLDFDKFELIIVDDGSTDNVIDYVLQNLNADIDVKVHHQTNMGILIALMNAIKMARNEYIIVFDSDDILSSEILNYLDGVIEGNNPDVIHYKNYSYLDYNNLKLQDTNEIIDVTNKKVEMMMNFFNKNMYGTLSEKCFKRNLLEYDEIIKNGTIRFTPDIIISFYIFMKCETIFYIDKTFYFAPINNNSTSKSFKDFRFEEYKQIYSIFAAYCDEDSNYGTVNLIEKRFLRETIYSIIHIFIGNNPKAFKIKAIQTVENDDVFKEVANKKIKIDFNKSITLYLIKHKMTKCAYMYIYLTSRMYLIKMRKQVKKVEKND